jgi:hypothetical protein
VEKLARGQVNIEDHRRPCGTGKEPSPRGGVAETSTRGTWTRQDFGGDGEGKGEDMEMAIDISNAWCR